MSHNTGTTIGAATIIFYKIAAGLDAAPTIAATTAAITSAQLYEFSGVDQANPIDQTATGGSTGSPPATPQHATAGAADVATGDLVVAAGGITFSAQKAPATSHTVNNAAMTATKNDAASSVAHYDFAYGLTTANANADDDSFSFTNANATGVSVSMVSFRAASAAKRKLAMIV